MPYEWEFGRPLLGKNHIKCLSYNLHVVHLNGTYVLYKYFLFIIIVVAVEVAMPHSWVRMNILFINCTWWTRYCTSLYMCISCVYLYVYLVHHCPVYTCVCMCVCTSVCVCTCVCLSVCSFWQKWPGRRNRNIFWTSLGLM